MKYKLKKDFVYNSNHVVKIVLKGTVLKKGIPYSSNYVDEIYEIAWDENFVENNTEWFEPVEEKKYTIKVTDHFAFSIYYDHSLGAINKEQKKLIEQALNGELYEEHELKGFLNFYRNSRTRSSTEVEEEIIKKWKESKKK